MDIKTLIERCAKGRHACFADNEEPRDVLISVALKRQIEREAEPFMAYMCDAKYEYIMGLKIEWVVARQHDISIRTVNGDLRIVP